MSVQQMTQEEWVAEAHRRFGDNPADWRFVCPACGHEACGLDFKNAGAKPSAMYQECIGRYTKGRSAMLEEGDGPCDYAAYGLFQLAPVHVTMDDGTVAHAFAFGEAHPEQSAEVPSP